MSSDLQDESIFSGENQCTYYHALNFLGDLFRGSEITLLDIDSYLREPWLNLLEQGMDVCEIYERVVPKVEEEIRGRLGESGGKMGRLECEDEENVVPGRVTPVDQLPVLLDVPGIEVVAPRAFMRAPPRPWERRV